MASTNLGFICGDEQHGIQAYDHNGHLELHCHDENGNGQYVQLSPRKTAQLVGALMQWLDNGEYGLQVRDITSLAHLLADEQYDSVYHDPKEAPK